MINMAFMPLYMWEMWDVTPVTNGRTVESNAVFSLSWIRNCEIAFPINMFYDCLSSNPIVSIEIIWLTNGKAIIQSINLSTSAPVSSLKVICILTSSSVMVASTANIVVLEVVSSDQIEAGPSPFPISSYPSPSPSPPAPSFGASPFPSSPPAPSKFAFLP